MGKLTLTAGLWLIIASLGLPGLAKHLPVYKTQGNPCYGGVNGPYPNPADPHTFYNCDWGNVYLQKCPGHLVYRHSIKACGYPGHTTPTTTTPVVTTSPPTTKMETTTTSSINPCYGGQNGLYPNPHDPHTFYKCEWGKVYLQKCPGHLVYRHSMKACGYPGPTSPPTTKIETTTTSSINPCYGGVNGPYPNPADPHTFYNCDWGNVYLQKCPGHLVYRHSIKACAYPGPTSPPTTKYETTTTSSINPCYGGENGLYPNPHDPHTFYKCEWGKVYLQKCPGHLVYRHSIKACGYPGPTSPPTTKMETTTTSSINPCYGGQNGLYPNPHDTHTFYKCEWGKVYLQKCPGHLVYKHSMKACGYPGPTSPPTTKIETTTTSSINPCYGGVNGPYPNPADPHTFYNCDWGNVYLQKCPGHLVYRHSIKACDYPRSAY
ncbi:uncharacterized protein AB9W97_018878 [Spinachia spinachia]